MCTTSVWQRKIRSSKMAYRLKSGETPQDAALELLGDRRLTNELHIVNGSHHRKMLDEPNGEKTFCRVEKKCEGAEGGGFAGDVGGADIAAAAAADVFAAEDADQEIAKWDRT